MSANQGSNSNTKDKILSSAVTEFASTGFDGATIADIAAGAGISEGAIYRHFKSKQHLLQSCLSPVFDEITELLPDELPKDMNTEELIRLCVQTDWDMFDEHFQLFKVLFGEMAYSEDIAQMYLDALQSEDNNVLKIYRQMWDNTDLKRPPQRSWFIILQGIVMGLWGMQSMLRLFEESELTIEGESVEVPREQLLDDLTELLMYGLAGTTEDEEQNKSEY